MDYLVALNKIDLNEVNINQAKKDLDKNGISIEEYGGKIVLVPTSAKTGEGVKELLEMILLLGEMMNLKGSDSHPLKGIILESKLDNRKGPLATVLVRDGSLKVNDEIKVGKVYGKVKALFDERGKPIKTASVSQPVEVLGFKKVPLVGEKVERTELPKEEFKEEKIPFKNEEVVEKDKEEGKCFYRLKNVLLKD